MTLAFSLLQDNIPRIFRYSSESYSKAFYSHSLRSSLLSFLSLFLLVCQPLNVFQLVFCPSNYSTGNWIQCFPLSVCLTPSLSVEFIYILGALIILFTHLNFLFTKAYYNVFHTRYCVFIHKASACAASGMCSPTCFHYYWMVSGGRKIMYISLQ